MTSSQLVTIPIVEAFLGGLELLKPVREIPGNGLANDGYMVNAIQRSTGNKQGDAWCASLMYYVGRAICGPRWPLPRTASCDALLTFGRAQGILVDEPARGDVFLRLASSTDAVHTGACLSTRQGDGRFYVRHGNTGIAGERDGEGVKDGWLGGADDHHAYGFLRWELLLR